VSWTKAERDPPSHDADPLEHLLFRQHSVISRRQALRVMTRHAVYHRVSSGRWQQPVRSIFVAQAGPLGIPQQRWIAVLASRGPLAAFSALEVLGLRGYRKPCTEILITASRRVTLTPPDNGHPAFGTPARRGRAHRRVAALDGGGAVGGRRRAVGP
jgi:hypothetical protein